MERTWIVFLEATRDPSGSPVDQEALRDLMEQIGCEQIVGLHHPDRYAIQLQMVSFSPAEALFAATARWTEALRHFGLQGWTLQRGEVLTPEEFERDQAGGRDLDTSMSPSASGSPATTDEGATAGTASRAPGNEGDDLLRSAFHDFLTGFPTLALFRDRVHGAVSRRVGSEPPLALLVLDVDGFGTINRQLGYIYGDQVLVELAGRLAAFAHSTATVARLAGDEFVLLVEDGAGGAGGAGAVAERLLEVVRTPIVVRGQPVVLTASVGIAPVDANSELDDRLRRAATAMCAAKEAGGNRWQRFEPGLRSDSARLDLVTHVVPDRLAYVMLLERAALAANECASVEEASAVVLHQVLAHTGWRAGHLWLVAESRRALRPSGVWHVSGPEALTAFRRQSESRTFKAGDGLLGRVLRAGKPEWTALPLLPAVPPLPLLPAGDARADEARQAGLAAAVAFPVLAGTEVVAVLEFFSTAPISPDESLLDVMAAVGAQLGRICERTRAAAALAKSETRYRMLADSLPALIWESGTDTQCTFVNRGWLDFTGRTAQEEAGAGWSEGVHPEDRTRCLRTYVLSFSRREPFEIEYRLRRADGEYRWLLSRGTPVFDGDEFAGYVGCCIDVTDRHQAEAGFRTEELRFRDLVANADVMIVVMSADGTVLDEYLPACNLGYAPGAERGRLGADYVHPDDRPIVAAEFARVVADPAAKRSFECRVRHADGSWRWVRAVANNMLGDPIIGAIVYAITDITTSKTLAQKLEDTERRLRESDDLLWRGTTGADIGNH